MWQYAKKVVIVIIFMILIKNSIVVNTSKSKLKKAVIVIIFMILIKNSIVVNTSKSKLKKSSNCDCNHSRDDDNSSVVKTSGIRKAVFNRENNLYYTSYKTMNHQR